MRPAYYVTIEIPDSNTGAGIPRPVVAGAILRVLHGAFRKLPGKFALALPDPLFSGLRVFAQSRDDLDHLFAAIESNPAVRDYGRIGYPRAIPPAYDGPWKSYSRFRIPTRKADREPDGRLRRARIEKADKERFPFFILSSTSSGQRFSLYLTISEAGPPEGECLPDSYGL